MDIRETLKDKRRIVIKVGSSSLVNSDLSINQPVIINIMQSFKELFDKLKETED